MKICITGAAGFVGSSLASALAQRIDGTDLVGLDNLSRRGSETNLSALRASGGRFVHGDLRCREDVEALPRADWVVDCAAIPSVMAGLAGDSAALVGHNLIGTLHLLEKCRRDGSGFLMLSTSRVYSIPALAAIPLVDAPTRLAPDPSGAFPVGSSPEGVAEGFSTASPVSLYGATKLASEVMALEYGATYGFPVWIDRCGVLAGPGQFGRADQGIISFWIYQWMLGRSLSYIGFGGRGHQVRDYLAPEDLADLVAMQLQQPARDAPRIVNVGGGPGSATSLRELSDYCAERFGPGPSVGSDPRDRPFDIPYYVTDNAEVRRAWGWRPTTPPGVLLDRVAAWAEANRGVIEAGTFQG